jgi:hypothetical protein
MTAHQGAALPRRSAIPPWLPLAMFALLFAAGRLWFLVDFPIGVVHPDSGTYFTISEAIQNGETPRFGDRSPLVPLVMAATFSVVNKVMAFVYVQTAFSFAAGLLMVWAVYSLQPVLSLPLAVALGAYFMDADALEHDSAVLSESLYTSVLMISFALFVKIFSARRPALVAGLCSFSLALVLYARPGGMFVLVIYAMVLAYFVWRHVPWRLAAAFAVPFPVLLLSLAAYNYRTIGEFVLSSSDATEIGLITNPYWETDNSYPPEINAAIVRVQQMTAERNTPDEMRTLNESWDFRRLYDLYLRSHYYGPHTEIAKVTTGWAKPDHRAWMLRISADAIAHHPDRFFKHFIVMMAFYYKGVDYNTDFRQYIYNRVNLFYIQKHFSKERGLPEMVRWGKEFADPVSLPKAITVVDFDKTHQMDLDHRIFFEDTMLTRVYLQLQRWLRRPFSSLFWSFAQILVFGASLFTLVRARVRHDAAFLLLVLACAPLGNAMVVSLVEYSQPRYSYPLEWAYYVTFLCLPLLLTGRNLLPVRGGRSLT